MEEQRSTFYPVATELRMSFQIVNKELTGACTSSCSFYSSKKIYLATVQGSTVFKRLEPHFQILRDEAGMEGDHGNCRRFATLTGVHQRGPYLPCQTYDGLKNLELRRTAEMLRIPLENFEKQR